MFFDQHLNIITNEYFYMVFDNLPVIGDGAEAIIYKNKDKIIKFRPKKDYRLKEIDISLRKFRTRREAKVIERLNKIKINAPNLISVDDKDMKICMDFIEGKKLRDIFEKDYRKYSSEIGKIIAELHNNGIIHGDLTTSNMILKDNKIFLIDFGLSFFSNKAEDKAVDLHLLKQALESKHWSVFDNAFKFIIESYKKHSKNYRDIEKRLSEVELRGRYKHKHLQG